MRFIKNAQALGFTLREIAELLSLRVRSTARCGDIQRQAQAKLEQVEVKVRELRALAGALRRLIRDCRAGKSTDQCPILNNMEAEESRRGSPTKGGECDVSV
jgi:MerR family mercuric resistance operon transcriptional regulator/MerR family gold-responsive transcriptional activator of gol and ges genes